VKALHGYDPDAGARTGVRGNRVRPAPLPADIKARNPNIRQYAERTAINAPMQGTAADIIKRAMIDLDRWLPDTGAGPCRMIMQVHDELVFEAPMDAANQLQKASSAPAWPPRPSCEVPLVVEARTAAKTGTKHTELGQLTMGSCPILGQVRPLRFSNAD
jgi:hypothetical protein